MTRAFAEIQIERPVFTGARHPIVTGLLRAEAPAALDADLTIHARDEMLDFSLVNRSEDWDLAVAEYMQQGLRILASIRQLVNWRFGGFEHVGSFLDFASGYGRVTRFLTQEMPRERLWIAEINHEAVAFQAEHFGVHAVTSTGNPESFDPAEQFDVIVATSLFSHLPPEMFRAWLRRLRSLLAPGGMLIFSVHDAALQGPGVQIPNEGYIYYALSESRILDTDSYGSMWVTETFVRSALAEVGGEPAVFRIPRGFANYQDIYIVVEADSQTLSPIRYEYDPEGYMDNCRETSRGLEISGWCAIAGEGSIASVELHLDGSLAQELRQFHHRPDVAAIRGADYERSGWHFIYPLPLKSRLETPLVVRALTCSGHSGVIYAGTVVNALLSGALLEAEEAKKKVTEVETKNTKALAQHAEAMAQVEALKLTAEREALRLADQIRKMEASRFWKMRNAWFRLKEKLRLS